MSKSYFKREEFYKPEWSLPSDVLYKIDDIIDILNPIREKLGSPIIVSKRSGYRPAMYELSKGRSGRSEHCFKGLGAVDLTCNPNKLQYLFELLRESAFTRVCMYTNNHFIHADLKDVPAKQAFLCIKNNKWESLP